LFVIYYNIIAWLLLKLASLLLLHPFSKVWDLDRRQSVGIFIVVTVFEWLSITILFIVRTRGFNPTERSCVCLDFCRSKCVQLISSATLRWCRRPIVMAESIWKLSFVIFDTSTVLLRLIFIKLCGLLVIAFLSACWFALVTTLG
jgi:hypothetical protein